MYYTTSDKIDSIFSRSNKKFYLIPWAAIHDDINASDISNHTVKTWADKYGKILFIDEFEDNFNSGVLNPKDYYVRVF